MSLAGENESSTANEARLPRRDWILLPLLSVLTLVVLLLLMELTARRIFSKTETSGDDCVAFNDPSTGPRGIPNSVCREKMPEGQPTDYRFNSGGFRADVEYGPKRPGTYRIVLLGTSTAAGFRVQREQSFAFLLPDELSRRTGLKVELYNEAIPDRFPSIYAAHFDEVLRAEPDLILLALNTRDLQYDLKAVRAAPDLGGRQLSAPQRAWRLLKAGFGKQSLGDFVLVNFNRSRTELMLRFLLYKSPTGYLKSFLIGSDDSVGYLKSEPSAEWQKRLHDFDMNDAKMEAQARAAGVPMVAALMPDRAQATMIQMGEWPAGFDPYKIDEELRSIVTSHGGIYIDLPRDLGTIPNPRIGYYPVDGHLNSRGQSMFEALLAKELTSGAIPALQVKANASAHGQGD
jgi:hypothetical protein